MKKKTCEECCRYFVPTRPDNKFCSDACKKKNWYYANKKTNRKEVLKMTNKKKRKVGRPKGKAKTVRSEEHKLAISEAQKRRHAEVQGVPKIQVVDLTTTHMIRKGKYLVLIG